MSQWNPDLPYQGLPDLPPERDVESTRVLKALIAARSSLAALNESLELIPNPTVLINTIPLLEAQSSSEIENIVTTTDELFRNAYDSSSLDESSPAKETLRYRTALRQGFESIRSRPLSSTTAIDVCRTIKGQDVRVRDLPGTKIANPSTGQIIYTPPEGQQVIQQKLGNWESFLHGFRDLDPLLRIAIAHYQFEAIHPFFDGNGRTGRILNILALVELELLELPVLYLSRYIIRNKSDYYRLLNDVTSSSNWEDWVLYMLAAITETSDWTRRKIREIRTLQLRISEQVREELPQVYRHELIEMLFEQPYCRIENVVQAGLAQRQTASAWLRSLVEIGVLDEVRAGRSKIFVNHAFFRLLITD